jgi:very-short-patch-repair endonuclease
MRARWAVGEIGRLCHELGGAVRTSELRACGVDARSVRRATVSGEVIRIRSGLYASPDLPWPTKVALRHGGVLACVSVARRLGLWVLPLDELVHVSLPANGHALVHSDCGCVQHWNALPVSSIEVTLVDALLQIRGCLGEDAFFVTLESALHLGLLDGPSRGELRARITESARWMVDFARNDAESGLESLLRIRLHRLGLRLRTQVEIPGVGRVDFVLGDRLILEVDGRAGHDGPDGRHRDRLRDAVATGHGFHTLRFDYELVVDDWPLVEQAILETIRRRATP